PTTSPATASRRATRRPTTTTTTIPTTGPTTWACPRARPCATWCPTRPTSRTSPTWPASSRRSTSTATSRAWRCPTTTTPTCRGRGAASRALPLLLRRRHPRHQLAPLRRGRRHPPAARVRGLLAALHHLRARPVRGADGAQALGPPGGVQPRQAARQAAHRLQQAARQREADPRVRLRLRGRDQRARDRQRGDRAARAAVPAGAGRGGVHPLPERLPRLRLGRPLHRGDPAARRAPRRG